MAVTKNRQRIRIILLCLGFSISGFGTVANDDQPAPAQTAKPHVLLISIDGYGVDYVRRLQPQTLLRLASVGASADFLQPVFPSKTYSNHLSLITGVYPNKHGIIGNQFYAPDLKRYFTYHNNARADGRFYTAWPLWSWAQRHRITTASMFWPGSEAEINGFRPAYFYAYNKKINDKRRIDQVLEWLELPDSQRPRFISVYLDGVDRPAHRYGPYSREAYRAIRRIDGLLGRLQGRLDQLSFGVNVIVVSDHGMATLDRSKVLYMAKLLPQSLRSKLRIVTSNTLVHIYSKNRRALNRAFYLLRLQAAHYNVYRRYQIPPVLNYRHHRAGDIVIQTHKGHTIESAPQKKPAMGHGAGIHGFHPDVDSAMHGIFYAWGPNIRPAVKIDALSAVDVAPLVLKILDLPPLPQLDGTFETLNTVYRPAPANP